MNLVDQICTLEQAKKLDELKVNQKESQFYWMRWDIPEAGDEFSPISYQSLAGCRENPIVYPESYSAFTLAEICEMLPNYNWAIPIFEGKIDQASDVFQEVRVDIQLLKNPSCRVLSLDYQTEWLVRYANTPTQAAASMLIKLLKMGLIGIDDVNKGLNK